VPMSEPESLPRTAVNMLQPEITKGGFKRKNTSPYVFFLAILSLSIELHQRTAVDLFHTVYILM
jgi:hypothetical protein